MLVLFILLACSSIVDGLVGNYSCTQSLFSGKSPSSPKPFRMSINGNTGMFFDNIDCSDGCYIDSKLNYVGYALTGYYHTGSSADAPIHGIWSIAQYSVDGLVRGLTYSFLSEDTYLIQCNGTSSMPPAYPAVALASVWDGTEYRMHTDGPGEVSDILLHIVGASSSAYFKDHFGCLDGCNVTRDFGFPFDKFVMFGYYHDPDGTRHGVWFMYSGTASTGSPFVFTTSFVSDYSYTVGSKPAPPCDTDSFQCSTREYNFSNSTCGAWIIWRHVGGSEAFVHQAFAYDDNWGDNSSSVPPSLLVNSGYYSCGDKGTGICVACGTSIASGTDDDIKCLGRVCLDKSAEVPKYAVLLTKDGLSDMYPREQGKTCWFRNPSRGEFIPCHDLWAAEQKIQRQWNECENFNAPPYKTLSHNCRFYVEAVVAEYCSSHSSDAICQC